MDRDGIRPLRFALPVGETTGGGTVSQSLGLLHDSGEDGQVHTYVQQNASDRIVIERRNELSREDHQ